MVPFFEGSKNLSLSNTNSTGFILVGNNVSSIAPRNKTYPLSLPFPGCLAFGNLLKCSTITLDESHIL